MPIPSPSETDASMILWDPDTDIHLKLFPMVIAFYEEDGPEAEALLLEEVKGKNLLYLYRDTFLKRKEEFRHLVQMLDARTIKVESISSEDLTAAILGERIDRITKNTLESFTDTFKYIPEIFVQRPEISNRLDSWLKDDRPGCILVGEPGIGKTCLVADWCIQRRNKGDHILLLVERGQ